MQVLGVAVILSQVLLGAAEGRGVGITVLPGAGSYVRADCQAPVQVILENDDVDRKGRVVVAFRQGSFDQVTASRSVALPPFSKKSVYLYLPVPALPPSTVEVRYVSERGIVVSSIAERLKNPFSAGTPIIAGIDMLPSGFPAEKSSQGDTRYQRIFLRPDQLPDRMQGLEMYDAIVISPPPYLPFESAQVLALRDWVLRGGILIVDASARTDVFRLGPFIRMLPFVPQGVTEADLEVFGETTPFAHGQLQGGEVLLESNGHPLVVRSNYGLGSVTSFAVSPGQPAFKRWNGADKLWLKLLRDLRLDEAAYYHEVNAIAASERKRQLTEIVQEPQRVGLRLGLVLLLTALYALAVGPGDYFLIRKLGRPKLTWITFPTMVAVFTIAAYAGAKAWVGGEMASDNAERLLIFPDHEVAIRYELVSLFAPGGRDYRLQDVDEGWLYNIHSAFSDEGRLALDHDEQALTHRIPIWQRRVYGSDLTVTEYPDIELKAEKEGDDVLVTATNHSKLTLIQNSVTYRGRIERSNTPRLDPGQSQTFRFTQKKGNATGPQSPWVQSGSTEPWPHGRQFDCRNALDRGAIVFFSNDAGEVQCPLIVDGDRRPEKGTRSIQVVTYPSF